MRYAYATSQDHLCSETTKADQDFEGVYQWGNMRRTSIIA